MGSFCAAFVGKGLPTYASIRCHFPVPSVEPRSDVRAPAASPSGCSWLFSHILYVSILICSKLSAVRRSAMARSYRSR